MPTRPSNPKLFHHVTENIIVCACDKRKPNFLWSTTQLQGEASCCFIFNASTGAHQRRDNGVRAHPHHGTGQGSVDQRGPSLQGYAFPPLALALQQQTYRPIGIVSKHFKN